MPKRAVAALLCVNLVVLVLLCVGLVVLTARMESLSGRTRETLDEIRLGLFHDAVDRVVEGARNEQEECVRVAEWIAGSIRNLSNDGGAGGLLGRWHARTGLCAARATLMALALRRLGIEAGVWNLYDYGFGHSCVQAFYGGRWHFFDPTYGGYFVGEDGHALSWGEIVADPQAAGGAMRVFKRTLDRSSPRGPRIRNEERMRTVYRAEALARAKNAGFARSRVFTLPVRLRVPLGTDGRARLGRRDGSKRDLRSPTVRRETRCDYLGFLGAERDNFRHAFDLAGVKPGDRVRLRFTFTGDRQGPRALTAASDTGRVTRGAVGPRCRDVDAGETWTVLYQAGKGDHHTVLVGVESYADEEPSYAELDAIEAWRIARRDGTGAEGAAAR